MNKRIYVCLLACAMLLMLGACRKNEEHPAESTAMTIATEETIPGVADIQDDASIEWKSFNESTEEEPSTVEETKDSVDESSNATQLGTTPTTAPETTPEEDTKEPSLPVAQQTEYEWYNSLSGEEQVSYMQSFDSIEAFFVWYNNAKAEHEAQKPGIEIEDGVINLEDLIGGNG